MLSVPAIKELIMKAQEHTMPNPFVKMGQLTAFLHKAVTQDRIAWAVELVLDFYWSNGVTVEDMGERALKGRGAQSMSNKGLVDLLVYKQQLLAHMVGAWLDSFAIEPSTKATIRDTFNNGIAHFRSKAGYQYNSNMPQVSSSWRAGWDKASDHIFELMEARGANRMARVR